MKTDVCVCLCVCASGIMAGVWCHHNQCIWKLHLCCCHFIIMLHCVLLLFFNWLAFPYSPWIIQLKRLFLPLAAILNPSDMFSKYVMESSPTSETFWCFLRSLLKPWWLYSIISRALTACWQNGTILEKVFLETLRECHCGCIVAVPCCPYCHQPGYSMSDINMSIPL